MEVLISNWSNVESVPKTYIFPPDSRPGKFEFPVCNDIPLIDLDHNHPADEIIQQVISACQKYGFFRVINHGVSENLMDETMNMYKEFFKLPGEYKAKFYSNDINKSCRIYSSTLSYDNEEFHYWRDNLTHRCHPLEEYIQSWPDKPTKYREVVGEYSIETRKLLYRILEMICKGLGLESGYFEGEMSKTHLISVNHHIPCPDPSLTLGMPVHSDPNLITLLHQCDVPGLQILKDGQWIGVNPVPDSLIVIPGLQLKFQHNMLDYRAPAYKRPAYYVGTAAHGKFQHNMLNYGVSAFKLPAYYVVISNDRFITPVHRVVTHPKDARTTIGVFFGPSPESIIKPAAGLVSCSNIEPVFRAFTYPEFFKAFSAGAKCDAQVALNHFRNKP